MPRHLNPQNPQKPFLGVLKVTPSALLRVVIRYPSFFWGEDVACVATRLGDFRGMGGMAVRDVRVARTHSLLQDKLALFHHS